MAHVEPMDIDALESDFDNKENAFQCNNVLSRTPCTEKGYEELDVSELNMKLRYSVTPASSPMSKSLTAQTLDNRNFNSEDCLNSAVGPDNGNLTRSLNSTLTKPENLSKSKALPLQTLSTDPLIDSNRNSSIRRLLDSTDNNVTISINANDADDNFSLPSPCSSVPETPEATTPTKEIPKPEGSPIMRGLKSVLSMFRPSQSPILPSDDKPQQLEITGPLEPNKSQIEPVKVSTPVSETKVKDASSSKRNSPLKDSLVFNDDLERELLWKDETTIIFKDERIPVHKLFFQNPIPTIASNPKNLNTTIEHMDISCDESIIVDEANENTETRDIKDHTAIAESDNEFLDCENTFTKNESHVSDCNKQEICNTVQVTGNVIGDLTNNNEILTGPNEECVNILKNTYCVTPALSAICTTDTSVSGDEVSSKIEENADIIRATINFLRSESYDCARISVTAKNLENKSEVINEIQLESANITAADREAINKYGLLNTNESQSLERIDMENGNAIVSDLQTSEEKKESEYSGSCDNDNPTGVYVENYHIDNPADKNSETLQVIGTKETIQSVDDLSFTIDTMDIVRDSLASDNRSIDIKMVDKIGDSPNITNKLLSSQDLQLQINTTLSNSNEYRMDAKGIEITPNKDIGTDCNFTNIDVKSDNNSSIIKEIEVKQITINENDVSVHAGSQAIIDKINMNRSTTDCKTFESALDDCHKMAEGIPSTEINKTEDLTISFSHADLNNTNNSPTGQTELNNATIVYSKSKFPEINVVIDNNIIIEDVLENKTESFSMQMGSKDNDNDVSANTDSIMSNVLDNDREVSEIIAGSDRALMKSPSEIPLPDDDDNEQNILSFCNKQDITMKYVCVEDLQENKLVADKAKVAFNDTENKGVSVIDDMNEHVTELPDNRVVVYKKPNNMQTCVTSIENLHITKTKNDNIDEIKPINPISDVHVAEKSNLPIEDSSQDISMLEESYMKVDQDVPEIDKSRNSENNVKEEKNLINPDNFLSETELVKNKENIVEINNIENCQDDNKDRKGHDSEKGFTDQKVEIDEEIITSANNSPYVSVTDLDKFVENNSEKTLDKIDNKIVMNTTFGSSPPISPKIVSKGYNFNFDEIDDPFATKTKIRMSPTPDSPNQSVSPNQSLSPNQSVSPVTKEGKPVPAQRKINRRKSQPERKKPIQKKNMNSTFNDKLSSKESISEQPVDSTFICHGDNISTSLERNKVSEHTSEISRGTVHQYDNKNIIGETRRLFTPDIEEMKSPTEKEQIQSNDEEIKHLGQTLVISTEKSTSSSEQYFSLGTSSAESSSVMNRSKNVFNLPEIDDMNFNPFATKSKMRMSPPPTEKPCPVESKNNVSMSSIVVQEQINNSAVKTELGETFVQEQINNNIVEKELEKTFVQEQSINNDVTNELQTTFDKKNSNDSLPNTSKSTCSSKDTNDINTTVREILTEDEDTVEGPFLELDGLPDPQKVVEVDLDTDMMNFDEILPQERDENLDNGELFIDADAFEFLLNQNKSTTVVDSGKESLFLKFDPLFANRVSSDGILAALSKVQKRQSTPKKLTKLPPKDFSNVEKAAPGPSKGNETCGPIEEYNEDPLSTITKPMMVVNPAVSSIVTQKKAATPKLNRRSLTFTSPAMAVIDRLLSLSGNSSHLESNSSFSQIGREHSETDLAITQLRELLAEKEINVHTLRSESKELKDRLAALEVQVKSLETESSERLAKINELNERLSEKTKMNKSMAIVVEEYERTIASLIAETEHDKKRNAEERMRLIKERDEQTAHLTSMEVSFSDLHSKYEKSKQIILSCKANEDIYKKSIKEFQDNFAKMQNNYELLKQHATSKLNHANQELEKMNRAHEAEVLKMNAMIKRKELHITSLEETLAQKTKANEELTAICDELINKVG